MSVPTDDPLMSVMEQEYAMSSNVDPKNMQELTIYVSHRPLAFPETLICDHVPVKFQVQNLLQNVQDKFQTMSDQIISRIDDMGNRIDDLEKSISDLMNQAGVEGGEK